MLLNYRKKATWDLLEQDLLSLCDKYAIQGLHLDNADSWPSMFSLDTQEMYRLDSDGQPAYSAMEIFQGQLVKFD